MDAAQERLQALSHTQQALMDKIKALDELDQADGEPLHPAPSASTCTPRGQHAPPNHWFNAPDPPFFHTDYGEQRHLQEANTVRLPRTARPRASLHRLRDAAAQPLDLPGLTRPCGSQAPQQPQDEEALLSMLLQKQAELQKMRAAIDELKTMDAGVTVRRATA